MSQQTTQADAPVLNRRHQLPPEASKKILALKAIPAMPMILLPLLELLQKPPDQISIDEVVRLVSYDKTIAAQCIRIAGSPLFGLARQPETIRGAIMSMGTSRLKDVVLTFSLGQILAPEKFVIDPGVFWKHSLGCALVSRHFCEAVGGINPEKAYLAALLHDIGMIVNCMVFPAEFGRAILKGAAEGIPLHEAERASMGFSHCETGQLLAESWNLPEDMRAVISCHHDLDMEPEVASLVAVVHLSDLLCDMRDMGYGYYESRRVDFTDSPAWQILRNTDQKIAEMDLARFTLELDEAAADVANLVEGVFAAKKAKD